MPAPQVTLFSNLAKLLFLARGIQLPTDWQDPGEQYPDAFQDSEKQAPPNLPTNLFREVSLNKYHVDGAKTIGDNFADYIDGICGAICTGIDSWMKVVTVSGVLIFGPVGILLPGGVQGPPLMSLILGGGAPMNRPQEIKYTTAIASAFGTLWQTWHQGLMGILVFPPTFAACPAPMHPPTPNIPLPLITFSSPGESGLSPNMLKSLMEANLGDPTALHASDLFESIAQAFSAVFQIFKVSTMVQNVLGTGPVPVYAPPFVPVGPVLGGTGTGPPGCFV